MRALVILLPLVACTERTPPPPRGKPVVIVDAAVVPRPRPDMGPGQKRELARRRDTLDAVSAGMRKRHFELQGKVVAPEVLPGELASLWPPGLEGALVGVGLYRRMQTARPAPGKRRTMMRWVSPAAEAEVRTALAGRLAAQGWVSAGSTPKFPLHRDGKRLEATFIGHPERATAVELELWDPDPGGALEPPAALLPLPPGWLVAPPGEVVGFEYDYHHGVVPKGRFTDVARYAVALSGDPATLTETLERTIRGAGYVPKRGSYGVFVHDNGATFRVVPDDGFVVAHHQQRWVRP